MRRIASVMVATAVLMVGCTSSGSEPNSENADETSTSIPQTTSTSASQTTEPAAQTSIAPPVERDPVESSAASIPEFCVEFLAAPTDVPELWMGSQDHLDAVQVILDVAPAGLENDLVIFRDYVASGAIDSQSDPDSNLTENWPTDVQDAVRRIFDFGNSNC